MRIFLLYTIFFHSLFISKAQQPPDINTVKLALKNAKHDTTRAAAYIGLGEQSYAQYPDTALFYFTKAKVLCEANLKKALPDIVLKTFKTHYAFILNDIGFCHEGKGDGDIAMDYFSRALEVFREIGNKKRISYALSGIADVYDNRGDVENALKSYSEALKLQQEIKDTIGTATSLNNIAYIYYNKGNIQLAIENWSRSLKLREAVGDKTGTASSLNNLASVYKDQGDYNKALQYFERSLALREQLADKNGIAVSYVNIGGVYSLQKKFSKALEYYSKSLALREETGNKKGIASSFSNIGTVYKDQGEYTKALEYYVKGLKIREEINDMSGIASSHHYIGNLYYYNFHEPDKAEKSLLQTLDLGVKLGSPQHIQNACEILNKIYKNKGNYTKAYEYFELYIKMRDSLNNIETHRAAIKQQTKYEYDKEQAIADEKHNAELNRQEEKAIAEKKKQNIIIGSVSIVLLLVAVFSALLFNRFKVTQKQKYLIEQKEIETRGQKHVIEEKHKEITDSINYAERIQRSFLATKDILDENLKDYFVFFKPKDIVSGDFYWASKLNNGNFALATADSTGHGVPGAIMSLLNVTSLEKAIENHTEPHHILDTTRKIIIDRLKKDGSDEGGKDGMDCSLCIFDFKNRKLFIAAAHNPVWIIRGTEIVEIKPDKMPVGKHDKQSVSFSKQEVELKKGDVIYALTDGFPDQFGGEKGKKYMSKNLRELLAKNSHLQMPEQKQLLEKEFTAWIGNLEQVDDVTVIGIRI